METIKIKLTFTSPILGTVTNNRDVYKEFLAGKCPKGANSKEAVEEAEAIPYDPEKELEKSTTIFARDDQNRRFLWNHMIPGFFKEACLQLLESGEECIKKHKRLSKYAYKRTIGGSVFAFPRQLFFKDSSGNPITDAGINTRPLRAETVRGERIALASSEEIPAGASIEFELKLVDPTLKPAIIACLDYGCLKGLGQWRGGGYGAFTYEIL